jgi:hypothetical protein
MRDESAAKIADPILNALPGRIKANIDPDANTAYYLGIKEKPKK